MKLLPFYEGPSPEMATGSAYCLKWNNHRTNLLSAFNVLLQQEAFTDVTLACEDGHTLHAHRLVLAACSSYFSSLFSSANTIHTDKHPIVILKDIKTDDMKAILEYMYRGEVNIERDALPNLLRVADGLRIKGLVGELSNETVPLPIVNHPHFQERRGRECPTPKEELIHNIADREKVEFKRCPSPYSESPEKRKSFGNSNGRQSESPPLSTSPVLQSPPRHHMPLSLNPYFPPGFLNIMERRELMDSSRERQELLSRPSSVDYKIPNHIPHLTPISSQPPNGLESPTCKRARLREPVLPPTQILRTALVHSHGMRHDVLASLANSMLPIQSQLNALAHTRLSTSPVLPSRNYLSSDPSRREADFHDQNEADNHQFTSQNLPFSLTKPKEEPLSDDDSKSFSDVSKDSAEKEKINRPIVPEFTNYPCDHNSAHFSNLAAYVPCSNKPEWKRYKQYSKADLGNAIEAVKGGKTALQASREHKVPSRTLYDKIKKMGISATPKRQPKRTSRLEMASQLERASHMDVDSTSDTPIAHLDVRTPDLFDQRPLSRNTLDHRSPAIDMDTDPTHYVYQTGRSVEDDLDRKRILDLADPAGTTRGSFSVVERKVLPDGNSLPLDLTEHSAIIPGRQQIEERA